MQDFITNFGDIFWKRVKQNNYDKIIFLCIGTDRVIGDSFGPMVGEKLKNLFENMSNVEIIGDLEKIVCVKNINNALEEINKTSNNPFIIGIDAALDSKNNVGKIIAESNRNKSRKWVK